MIIRKISIGVDPLNCMSFQVGKQVMNAEYIVYAIIQNEDGLYDIWIEKDNEAVKWKSIGQTTPVSLEYDINF